MLARRLLQWALPAEHRESILGDLDERYGRDVHEIGVFRARLKYWKEIWSAFLLRREVQREAHRPERPRRRRGDPMQEFLQDLRYSARMLRTHPGLAATAAFAIGLGIGLPTTMFSIVNGVLADLPFEQSQRLVSISRMNPSFNWDRAGVPLSEFLDWQQQQTSFAAMGIEMTERFNVSGSEGRAQRYKGAVVSANTFDLLGIRPSMGRSFTSQDASPAATPVVILGHPIWQNRFGGDPGVLGQTIKANGIQRTVVGIMPEGFRFPSSADMWIPLVPDGTNEAWGAGSWYRAFGRLQPGASIEEANVQFATIADRLALAYPETNEDVHVLIEPYTYRWIGRQAGGILRLMLATVSFVLLIACANVANLLLARAALRTREVAVRTALGASRSRIAMQLMTEAFMLAVAGGALGIGIAYGGVGLFNYVSQGMDMLFWIDVRMDATSALFIVALVIVASLAAGIAPALQASGTDANEILKDEGRGASSFRLGRLSKALVVSEVALSCALLVASGLMIKGVLKLRNMDYGFEAEQLFVADVEVLPNDYPDAASRLQFFEQLEERVGAIPGVLGATLTSTLPARGNWNANVGFEGTTSDRVEDYPMTNYAQVTPSFFHVFQAFVLDGRGFTSDDRLGSEPVAIVNQRFADMYYPGERAVGRLIRRGGPRSQQPWRTIVGVVSNAHITEIDSERMNPDGVYLPLAQGSRASAKIVLLTPGDPLELTPSVRAAVESVDPNIPLSEVNTLAGDILSENKVFEVFGRLFMLFGGAALFLATVGLYGVMSFAVSRRTKEMGLRMALGAHRTDVLGIVVKQGMWQLAAGLALGLVLAGAMSRGMATAFYQVDPWDKGIFGIIIGVLFLTGLLATLIPAHRATRVDPMVALRYE